MNHKSSYKRSLSSDYGPDLKKSKISSETRKTPSHWDPDGPKRPIESQCLYVLTRKHSKDPSRPYKTQCNVLDIFNDAEAAYNAMKRAARKAQWWKDENFDYELWTMSYDPTGNLMLKFDGDVEGKGQSEFKVVKKMVRSADVKPVHLKMKVDAELKPQRRLPKHHRSSSREGCTALSRYDVKMEDSAQDPEPKATESDTQQTPPTETQMQLELSSQMLSSNVRATRILSKMYEEKTEAGGERVAHTVLLRALHLTHYPNAIP